MPKPFGLEDAHNHMAHAFADALKCNPKTPQLKQYLFGLYAMCVVRKFGELGVLLHGDA